MSKKEYCLIGLIVVLFGSYVVFFTDWFRPKIIHIEHSARSLRTGAAARSAVGNVTFSLRNEYELTSVKVVPLEEYLTNQFAHPLWELTSEKGSPPIDGFAYGLPLPGMTPKETYVEPYPLKPGVEYRLIVEAGSAAGEHDFKISTRPVARR
jgi:hypothetical protein